MHIFGSNCKVYVAISYRVCYYNILEVKNKGFMLQQYIKGNYRELDLGLEGGVKEMSRPREAFKILRRKSETRVHLKVDEAREGCTGK